MASHPSEGVHTASPASPIPDGTRYEILQELVETASSAVNAQFDTFTTHLSDALLQVAANSADPDEAKRFLDAGNLLKKNRYRFYYLAAERLAAVLQHEIEAAENPSVGESDAGALMPMPPDLEIDKKLTLRKASRAIESEHSERLASLGIRLAHLYGEDALNTRRNPFRPHVFLGVIHDAWCEFQPDAQSHYLVFPLLQPNLFLDMAPILHALNATMVRRGILPRLSDSARSETSDASRTTGGDEDDGNDALARQLRRFLGVDDNEFHFPAEHADRPLSGAFPTLFANDILQEAAARKALFSYLAGLRKREDLADAALLERVRRQAPQDALSAEDLHVFALLEKIFATVFRDEHIAPGIKSLIGSLQVPLLEAALTDKNFFFSKAHPARRMIELLAQLGLGWDSAKGADDPLHQALLRNVKRIRSDRRVAVFFDAVTDLEAFIEKEESRAAEALSAPIAQALQQEKLQQANLAAKHQVALRIGTGEVVAFVEAFLEDKWVSVLTLAYSVQDTKPQAVKSAVKTMDDLIWSVQPKITMDERKELLDRLPSILAMLNKWLDLIKWDDAGRANFFAELAQCHASIVRAPLKLTPKRQVELALAAAQEAAERRRKKLAQAQAEPAPDEFTQQVQELQRGTWLLFTRKDGSTFKARLAWVSPMRGLYVFATRERQEALSLTAETLAQAIRCKRAHILLAAGLVERALADALGVGSANSDSMGTKSAA